MSDEAVRKARQFAESNHAYLADVTIELLAKYGQAARSAAIEEVLEFAFVKSNPPLRDAIAALKER